MPAVASLTDFNDTPMFVLNDPRTAQNPTHLTKNSKMRAVIMNAEAFDHMMTKHDVIRSHEERVYNLRSRSKNAVLAGRQH